MDLSIVIPFYNEEDSVGPLCNAVVEAMEPLHYSFEVILVDDGSSDDTFPTALGVAEGDKRFRIIKLSSNCGQTAALYAGIEQAAGKIIVTMDGDLQNDPRDIEAFMDRMNEGYDFVAGWRENRQDYLISRKVPSRIANWMVRKAMGTPIKDNGCGLRAYRADVISKFSLYSEMHRLLPTMLAMSGAAISQIQVRHHPRQYGTSKYGLSRIYKVLFDLIALKTIMTSFRLPFFGFGISAIVCGLLSAIALLGAVALVVGQSEIPIYVVTGIAMLWGLLGISLLVFGVLCGLIYSKASFRAENLLKLKVI